MGVSMSHKQAFGDIWLQGVTEKGCRFYDLISLKAVLPCQPLKVQQALPEILLPWPWPPRLFPGLCLPLGWGHYGETVATAGARL